MRLFICDPACVQPFGHNVIAMKYFRDSLQPSFSEVIPLCCRYLASDLAETHRLERFYNFYYPSFMKADVSSFELESEYNGAPIEYIDHLEWVATKDAVRMASTFHITSEDVLFFPHLDFYGVIGALNTFARLPKERQPMIYLRFIGVMENATQTYREPTSELASRIRLARKLGLRISCSAETPRLADALALALGDVVAVTPYPDFGKKMAIPLSGGFIFFCPGSARLDKGFLKLADVFRAVRRRDKDLRIRFVTQTLPYGHDYQNYSSSLYAIPGVELLEPVISEADMLYNYERCSALLLPYDRVTYERRGSAAMMEGISFGRPVITFDGTAFSDQVRFYGAGAVVSTLEEMVEEIFVLARRPKNELELQANQADYRYKKDVRDSYNSWLSVTR